ncbi:MAG TPA: hypothetical protein PLZ55_02830 [bacterium]|nr:hypothetical protein [bacterium]HPO07577.1 hypothetical protein [bacterium]HQO34057.1 hypothetical protein [bacterium]HQP99556.1 hypothetical protein [bacterium]
MVRFSHCIRTVLFAALVIGGSSSAIPAEELTADEHTVLLFHFNNSLDSTSGQSPDLAEGILFENGMFGQGVRIHRSDDPQTGDRLRYAVPEDFNPAEGSVECWIQPRWIGSDFYYMQVFNLKEIRIQNNIPGVLGLFMRITDNEVGYLNVEHWQNTEWHYVAATWKIPGRQKMYVDGALIMDNPATEVDLPESPVEFLWLGSTSPVNNCDAVIDEFRLSDIERTPQEIGQSVMKGDFQVSAIRLSVDSVRLQQGRSFAPKIVADTNIGVSYLPNTIAQWTVADPGIATIDELATITGIASGTTTFTAQYRDVSVSGTIKVDTVYRQPDESPIDDYLATPAANAIYDMPIVIVNFFPMLDEEYLEHLWDTITVETMKERLNVYYKRMKFMLEEGSRYHGYKDPAALPSLGLRIVKIINIYEHMPMSKDMCWWNPSNYYPDYQSVFERINGEYLVNELGVKEFWIWYDGYRMNGLAFELPESNMSSPVTGDISNSARLPNDLPVYNHFYSVYQLALHRLGGIHNHGHQMESMLSYVNERQDGNIDLFIHKFCGMDETNTWITGRCGWTHMPPNIASDYIYDSTATVLSDCEDWHPDGGIQKPVNVDTWRGMPYPWPEGTELGTEPPFCLDFSRAENQFYMYWRQNIPGYQNGIVFDGNKEITNWWRFIGDWDNAIREGVGLYKINESAIPDAFRR